MERAADAAQGAALYERKALTKGIMAGTAALIVTALLTGGCGVDWFPDDSKPFSNTSSNFTNHSTAKNPKPDPFTFSPTLTQNDILFQGQSPSNEVTLTGFPPTGGWDVTVADIGSTPASASNIVINSTTINVPGPPFNKDYLLAQTVKAGDKISVIQFPQPASAGTYITKIIIGTYSTNFTTIIHQ